MRDFDDLDEQNAIDRWIARARPASCPACGMRGDHERGCPEAEGDEEE